MYSLENCICLYKDIRTEILSLMPDKDINLMLSTNKNMYNVKRMVIFDTIVNLKQILELNYFDSFVKIKVDRMEKYKFPKNIETLIFERNFDGIIESENVYQNDEPICIIPPTVNFLSLRGIYLINPGYIPKSVKTLFLHVNQEITPGIIPDSITELYLYGEKYSIVVGSIPNSVKKVSFSYGFDQKILPGFIPESVVNLNLGRSFKNDLSQCSIPKSVKKLHLSTLLNIPCWIEYLNFDFMFDEELFPGSIPDSVTHLKFDLSFNQKIKKNILPRALTHLTLSEKFNQQINHNVLPSTLTHLTFGDDFNQEILPGILPDSIQYLVFGINYNKKIESFPSSLIYLKLGEIYSHKINAHPLTLYIGPTILHCDDIPKSVTKLILSSNVKYLCDNSIPITVTYLKIVSSDINIFEFNNNISDNLQILKIHPKINIPSTIRQNIRIRYFQGDA